VLDQICNRFDADMNDEVTRDELHAALLAEGVDAPTAEAVRDAVFQDWDADGDARLALSELRALSAAWAAPPGDQS
jgi:hypothetical protein